MAPGGEVVIVDFGDMQGLARSLRDGLRAWLHTFHVKPIDLSLVGLGGGVTKDDPVPEVTVGPFGYFVIARLPPIP